MISRSSDPNGSTLTIYQNVNFEGWSFDKASANCNSITIVNAKSGEDQSKYKITKWDSISIPGCDSTVATSGEASILSPKLSLSVSYVGCAISASGIYIEIAHLAPLDSESSSDHDTDFDTAVLTAQVKKLYE